MGFPWQVMLMPVNERICPKCGKPVKLMLLPGGKGSRTYQCIHCDRPDPLKSPEVKNLLKAFLPDEKQ